MYMRRMVDFEEISFIFLLKVMLSWVLLWNRVIVTRLSNYIVFRTKSRLFVCSFIVREIICDDDDEECVNSMLTPESNVFMDFSPSKLLIVHLESNQRFHWGTGWALCACCKVSNEITWIIVSTTTQQPYCD